MKKSLNTLVRQTERLALLLGYEHLSVADAYISLGLALLDKNDANNAKNAFWQALKIRKLVLRENEETIAQAYYYLGLCYFKLEEFERACGFYQKSIDIYENECLPEDTFMAVVLESMAEIFLLKNNFCLAEKLMKRSIFIRLCVLDIDDNEITKGLSHLAKIYSYNGQFDKAENVLLYVLDLCISNFGLDHISTVCCLENYAEILINTGRANEAKCLLGRVELIRAIKHSST